MYRSIVACRSDTCTIGRPGKGIDKTRMVIIGVEVPTGKSIPYQYFLVIARRSDARTIRRPRHGQDFFIMAAICKVGGSSRWEYIPRLREGRQDGGSSSGAGLYDHWKHSACLACSLQGGDTLQFSHDDSHTGGPLVPIHIDHLHDEFL